MTLIERLKPFYKQVLEHRNIEYPAFVGYLCDELGTTKKVDDLKWGVVTDLKAIFGNVNSPYDYFTEL